ncbi:MAG: tRNA epoxyqueuosine(34) reductase QueG [Prevotella sp.]|nr:tRNA epoxyqueuosine(34) reductase QueG [Prevotella sp.]MBF1585316.1 tRNA epoxyqueuosine(34) reductase QueG [Prevotella sp.]
MNLKHSNDIETLTLHIKAEAQRLGFFACGIAQAKPVDEETAKHLKQWLNDEKFAGMGYMNNNTDKRLDPRLLLKNAQSIICVALNYAPKQTFAPQEYHIANYALGQDYHDIMKHKLRQLAASCGFEDDLISQNPQAKRCRIFVDSGPILERYWAEHAGLGWIGKNHQLIIPNAGSMFFLGEILVDQPLLYDEPAKNRCGKCTKCLQACPTKAITSDNEIDAFRCLSYQTIENRSDIAAPFSAALGNTIYGCDECLKACPWNRFAIPNDIPELQPRPELMAMTQEQWQNLTEDEYRKLFKGSAVKRAKYQGLMRNIKAAACASQKNKLSLPPKRREHDTEN